MCGIAGYIGRSKKPKLTFELITCLFDYLELRGTDASGVYATEIGDGRVIYHKEPTKSSEFVQKEFWQGLSKIKTNLMLCHARATSTGNGHASNNANNHPFTSLDKRIGMVHNGTLTEFKYLKDKYEIKSNTDSEVLLRMFEHGIGEGHEVEPRIKGIKQIWEVIEDGAMAVGIGERVDADIRYLFLFRNSQRPLWVADLRELLGQVFFFSSPSIWYGAISSSEKLGKMVGGVPDLIEIPPKQIWCLWLDSDNPYLKERFQVEKYDLITKDSGKQWEAGDKLEIPDGRQSLDVHSPLGEDDKLVIEYEDDEDDFTLAGTTEDADEWRDDFRPDYTIGRQIQTYPKTSSGTNYPSYQGLSVISPPKDPTDHEEVLLKIGRIITDIEVKTNNLLMQGTLSAADYQDLIDSLEQTEKDLSGTLNLLQG